MSINHVNLVEAVRAHPPVPVCVTFNREKVYDLRDIALHLLERETAERSMDWWNAPRREKSDGEIAPIYFLSFELELAAYRLIVQAAQGEVLSPALRFDNALEYAAYVRAVQP